MENNVKIKAVSAAGIGILVFAALVVTALIVYWVFTIKNLSAARDVPTAISSLFYAVS